MHKKGNGCAIIIGKNRYVIFEKKTEAESAKHKSLDFVLNDFADGLIIYKMKRGST